MYRIVEVVDKILWKGVDPIRMLHDTILDKTYEASKFAFENLKGKDMIVEVTVREDAADKGSNVKLRCSECGRKWNFARKHGERMVKGAVGVWVLVIDKDNSNYPAMQIPCPDCDDVGYVELDSGEKT